MPGRVAHQDKWFSVHIRNRGPRERSPDDCTWNLHARSARGSANIPRFTHSYIRQ